MSATPGEPYSLTLFVSGASEASAQAIADVRALCDRYLAGRFDLSVVDLNQEPGRAGARQVLATPTLVRTNPLPERVLVGDMSDHSRVLLELDLRASAPSAVR